ncbi:hypothetical protein [Streptomyces sp. SS8]
MKLAARKPALVGSALVALAFNVASCDDSPSGDAGDFVRNPVALIEPPGGARLERDTPDPDPPYRIEGVHASLVDDASYVGERCGERKVREATGAGPVVLMLKGEESVESSYSAYGQISRKTFDEGFEVQSREIVMAASYEVPGGKFGRLTATPLYDVYRYWANGGEDRRISGTAAIPVGYCYVRSAS